jgi:L-alanine-DL-glutamate epimerase-like enolase superfamily enzyme
MIRVRVEVERLMMKQPFVITGYVFDAMPAIVVTLTDGVHAGRGEAQGVYYLQDDTDNMVRVVESVRGEVEAGLSRAALQTRLPPGGARNALDCALWELEAARSGQPVWRLAGFDSVKPLVTTMTSGAQAPEEMARTARGFTGARAIKLKLTGEPALDVARVAAVRAACPQAWLGVDANQGYSMASLETVLPDFVAHDVKLVEQPLPRGQEDRLDGFESPIPIAADESLQSLADMPALAGRFQVANLKLDKCGGLTEALEMARRARDMGLSVMVGNMAGTSWAMAPAYIVGQLCEIVDLDGPVSLAADRTPAVVYQDGMIVCDDRVWGLGVAGKEAVPS